MEFGVFHEFPQHEGQSEADAFAESFELVDACEDWGLDVLWLAELHFAPSRSVLSAPLTVASAIAGRTRRMKVGLAVQVLPLVNPLRLAEDAATVDHVSQGRLIFGVGRSGFPRAYDAYGVPYGESRERFAESLEIILKAWTQPTFSHSGPYHHFTDVCLVPKPYQRPHPPIRVAANSPDTFPASGSQGYPIFVAVRLGTLSQLAPSIVSYRAAREAAGQPGQAGVFLRVPVYVAETREQALSEPEESIIRFYRHLGNQLAETARRDGVGATDRRLRQAEHLQTVGYDQVLREKVVVGTPDMVVDRLRELRDELGLDGILAEPNCGGLIPHERVMRSTRLLCEQVMPRFK